MDRKQLIDCSAFNFAKTLFCTEDKLLTVTDKLYTYDLMRLAELTFKYREWSRLLGTDATALELFMNALARCAPHGRIVTSRSVADQFVRDSCPAPRVLHGSFVASCLSAEVIQADRTLLLALLHAVYLRLQQGMEDYVLVHGSSALVDAVVERLTDIAVCK